MDSKEALMASMVALAVLEARSEGRSGSTGPDPLRDRADACLEGLEETARMEAMMASMAALAVLADRSEGRAASPR